ncbi:glycerate kinase [Emticicia aquatilis]|uniref:Glycerate kinase n=1 Tax=Emticicia aquatilis TaxID=1537369 RepID=A0A916YJB4_9BACT|nr:glycerate kinase [Emticicia aquatilis]GGD47667.1 glycerate kinase [Emticicia aquatilis]
MKILLTPDKFRGSLDAQQVCEAMAEGIRMVSPAIDVVSLPMADGGEGTLDLLLWYSGGKKQIAKVQDPFGRIIEAEYGISADGKTAFIEMATASGLRLLKADERNPLKTSTFGTGELIKTVVALGVENIILGIGGSATTDAGIGMAAALGWQFLDENGQELNPIGENLLKVKKIQPPIIINQFPVLITVACDVTNPLFGENGAAYIYGPQKGADKEAVELLDKGLQNISEIFTKDFGKDYAQIAGTGAAGGLGFGLMAFMNAQLKEGVKLLMDFCAFEENLKNVNLIITGEGKIDNQTLQGKLIKGITDQATHAKIPIAAICGTLDVSPKELQEIGINYATSILNRPMNLDDALKYGHEGVRNATFYLVNLLHKSNN